jgi:hypothetical protein
MSGVQHLGNWTARAPLPQTKRNSKSTAGAARRRFLYAILERWRVHRNKVHRTALGIVMPGFIGDGKRNVELQYPVRYSAVIVVDLGLENEGRQQCPTNVRAKQGPDTNIRTLT